MACPWALGSGRYNHEPHEVNHLPDPREEETQAGRRQVRVAWVGEGISHQAAVVGVPPGVPGNCKSVSHSRDD